MNKIKFYVVFVIVMSFLFSCEKEDDIPAEFKTVEIIVTNGLNEKQEGVKDVFQVSFYTEYSEYNPSEWTEVKLSNTGHYVDLYSETLLEPKKSYKIRQRKVEFSIDQRFIKDENIENNIVPPVIYITIKIDGKEIETKQFPTDELMQWKFTY